MSKFGNVLALLAAGTAGIAIGMYFGKKEEQKVKELCDLSNLKDHLSLYEEVWESDGKQCKYIVKKDHGRFVKLEKCGSEVTQSNLSDKEALELCAHLDDFVWAHGVAFQDADLKRKSYGRCVFENKTTYYVSPFYFFKGESVVL